MTPCRSDCLGQDTTLQEVVRSFGSVSDDVSQQLLLHDDGDQTGDVGVPDEQPVAFVAGSRSVFAQRHLQQVLPKPAFHRDRRVFPMLVVGFL